MREFVKSMLSFSWALSLFGAKQFGELFVPGPKPQRRDASLDTLAQAAAGQLDETIQSAFQTGDRLQRKLVDAVFDALPTRGAGVPNAAPGGSHNNPAPPSHPAAPPARPVHRGRLQATRFLVLGEGLAAGMGDFALSAATQRTSFPAQMAAQMQLTFTQALLQAPGLGAPPGFTRLPVILPTGLQTTVLEQESNAPLANLAVPGFTLADALRWRPVPPLVHRRDAKQTLVNLAWGAGALTRGERKLLPTQLEYAVEQQPDFVLIELGYQEALESAVNADPALLPEASAFHADYTQLLASLKETGAELLVLTIPDPLSTAYCAPLELAARLLKVEADFLRAAYDLRADDLLTVHGLNEIGFQLFGQQLKPLPDNCILSAEAAHQISTGVRALNAELMAVASEAGALVYDLHALFQRVHGAGIKLPGRTLTAEYLGGFYSLNSCYPGATGQAVIANELLHLLNGAYGADFPQIDMGAVLRTDPVAAYRQAAGPNWTTSQLQAAAQQRVPEVYLESFAPEACATAAGSVQTEPLASVHYTLTGPLQLPPDLEQVLPLNEEASYFGDGIAALNCLDEQGIKWGSCGELLFGGLAMVDSHLRGALRIKFSPPVNQMTRFEVSFLGGLSGADAVLDTPQFFKMAFQQSRVDEVPGQVSAGTLNLATGEVSDLQFYARYSSTALFALVSVNPTFPNPPNINFPGQYGSAWAKFEPRPDGKLDFTFYGSTFVPLGPGIVWPLNFVGPAQQFATIPASGTVMHPHLCLSTKAPPASTERAPELPYNTLQELTLYTHNSSFGDAFTLSAPELGGPAKGRSHLLGRLQLQFGPRCGNTVPVAITCLDAGGLLKPLDPSPITAVFPGRLGPGPRGFNELLRFPLRTYSLNDVAILGDPFDIAVGAVDVRTGRFITDLLQRGFINQDLIFALLRVEPRTPKDSFFFRGPALLECGTDGRLVFRYQGIVRVPYPAGFLFPHPNLTTGFPIGPDSVLDPFLWQRAIEDDQTAQAVKEGEAYNVLSSAGELFSYHYRIPGDLAQQTFLFEYENHTQGGSFRLQSLTWVGFSHSLGASGGACDTVTFTGFGVWRKDGVESWRQASAQISTAPATPYVGIQIDGGNVSDVNTKPADEYTALP